MELSNYRLKVIINFINLNKDIRYDDNISDIYLIDKINYLKDIIFKLINNLGNNLVNSILFQKSNYSNTYGIIINIHTSNDITNSEEYINKLYGAVQDPELVIFGYNNNNVKYLSFNNQIINKYYDFEWKISMTSFMQTHPNNHKAIHNVIDEYIRKGDNYYFYGLGGESGVYQKQFKYNHYKCFTDSSSIYNDNISNNINTNLVDYNSLKLDDYIINSNDNILLINIGIKGLKELSDQIINLDFKQIIYIGCSYNYIEKDLKILTNKFDIDKKFTFNNNNDINIYVLFLIPKTLK